MLRDEIFAQKKAKQMHYKVERIVEMSLGQITLAFMIMRLGLLAGIGTQSQNRLIRESHGQLTKLCDLRFEV